MHPEDRAAGEKLEEKIPVAHRVQAVRRGALKAEVPGERLAVDGERRARQGSGPERQDVHPLEAIPEAFAVALEHEDIGEEVMGEEDRLGPLQVRVAGHGDPEVLFRPADQRGLDFPEPPVHPPDHVPKVEPLVERDLVVSRAAGVKLPRDGPDFLREPLLDVRVDVFEVGPERERPGGQLLAHVIQPPENLGQFLLGQEASPLEGAGPRPAPLQIVGPEPAVECERSGEAFGERVGRAGEAPPPELAVRSLVAHLKLESLPRGDHRFGGGRRFLP